MAAVERIPVPYWFAYLMFFALQAGLLHIVAWVDDYIPLFQFEPVILVIPLWLWIPLAIITYLDGAAANALRTFRPLLKVNHETFQQLEYEFTTMPFRPVIISGFLWLLAFLVSSYLAFPIWTQIYTVAALAAVFGFICGLLTFFTGTVIYYHTIRQLQLINQVVAKVPRFNLFRLDPIYAFSGLTARTGIAWIFLLSLTLLVFPLDLNPIPLIILSAFQAVLALAAFILPLWRVHQALVSEKQDLMADRNQRVEVAIQQLHRCLEEDDLGKVEQINTVLAALTTEYEVLAKIPTWPWRAGTLTGFLSVIVLPILLLIVQLLLQNWLVP